MSLVKRQGDKRSESPLLKVNINGGLLGETGYSLTYNESCLERGCRMGRLAYFLNEVAEEIGIDFKCPRSGDGGYDLYSTDYHEIPCDMKKLVHTGVHVAIPDGYIGIVFDRSSMAKKDMERAGGVIDPSYRGEIVVLLRNNGFMGNFVVNEGDKIAQLLIVKNFTDNPEKVTSVAHLGDTERGQLGFGSTGSR